MSLEATKRRIDIKLHPKQGKAYRSTSRIVLCSSGIQGGKSFVGAWKLRRAIEKEWPVQKYPQVAFAVTCPDHKTLVQSTRQAFDKIFYGQGVMHEMEQTYYLKDGRKIYFRTMNKNPWSVEGIQNVAFIWADEACQYPRLAYINLQSRTAIMQGQLFMTSTPYATNWPKRDIIDKWKKGEGDIEYLEWLSCENPAFPKDEYERQKSLMSKRDFERKYMGVHTRMEGLVFEDLRSETFVEGEHIDLSDAYVVGGIDWGFAHPMGISIRAILPDGQAYGINFFKGQGLSTSQVIDLVKAKTKAFGVKLWGAGADRPDLILELQNQGIPVQGYYEGNPDYREVDAGNQKLAELIKTGQYKIFKGSQGVEDLRDEYETYHWDAAENETEKATRPKPVKINDDLMDAERYATTVCIHKYKIKLPKKKLPMNHHLLFDTWRPTDKKKPSNWDAY